jgi:hypothetical protein
MVDELQPLIDKVWRHCDEKGSRGRTVSLKMKFNDFEIITRSRSMPIAVSSRSDLERLSIALLQNEMPLPNPVRLLGVSLSALQGRTAGRAATRFADLRRQHDRDFKSGQHEIAGHCSWSVRLQVCAERAVHAAGNGDCQLHNEGRPRYPRFFR